MYIYLFHLNVLTVFLTEVKRFHFGSVLVCGKTNISAQLRNSMQISHLTILTSRSSVALNDTKANQPFLVCNITPVFALSTPRISHDFLRSCIHNLFFFNFCLPMLNLDNTTFFDTIVSVMHPYCFSIPPILCLQFILLSVATVYFDFAQSMRSTRTTIVN